MWRIAHSSFARECCEFVERHHFDYLLIGDGFGETAVTHIHVRGCLAGPGRLIVGEPNSKLPSLAVAGVSLCHVAARSGDRPQRLGVPKALRYVFENSFLILFSKELLFKSYPID